MSRHRQLALACLVIFVAACESASAPDEWDGTFCARPAMAPIVAIVRDQAGTPAAVGASVVITDRLGHKYSAKGFVDSLRIGVGENQAGRFDVEVTKPWHAPVLVRGIQPATDGCGITEAAQVAVSLNLLPNAPPVRQVVTPPYGYGFGWGNMRAQLVAKVVGAPGVSQEVVWTTRDSTVVRIQENGDLTTRCRSSNGSTWAIAAARADLTKTDSVRITVYADRDPTRCP